MYLSIKITLLYKSYLFLFRVKASATSTYIYVLHVNVLSFVKIMEMGQCSVDNYERLLQLRSAEANRVCTLYAII